MPRQAPPPPVVLWLSTEMTVPWGRIELPDVEHRSVAIGCFVQLFEHEKKSRGPLDLRAGRACLAASVAADAEALPKPIQRNSALRGRAEGWSSPPRPSLLSLK